jgi:uncharacterized protein YndB with AHSA1/START domain
VILKTIAVIAVLIIIFILAVLLFATTKPSTFQVERSVTIQAPPGTIFMMIDDLHIWPRWSPQDLLNPKMKRTYSGNDTGVGAASDWNGPRRAGKGHMVITESVPQKSVVIKVDWEKPFAAENINRFTFEPDGTGTKVTWSLQGQNVYAMKVMGVFMNVDRKMGEHLELGLSDLKAIAESPVLRSLGQ